MKPEEFIDTVIIRDIGRVIDAGCAYLAFGLIAKGIETLGAILDEKSINDSNLSEARFRKAINELFSAQGSKYPKFAAAESVYDLYKNLRCGMVHSLIPGGLILFTHKIETDKSGLKHLTISENNQLVLVVEDLYDDFVKACIKCKNKLPKKTHPKLKEDVLIVSPEGSGGKPNNLMK